MKRSFKNVMHNLGVMAIAGLPLWIAIAWIWDKIFIHAPFDEPVDAGADAYIVVIAPLLVATAIHQITFFAIGTLRPRFSSRGVGLLLLPIIPLALAQISVPLGVQFMVDFAPSTITTLVVFGLVMRLPQKQT